jgi:hypothetical protein
MAAIELAIPHAAENRAACYFYRLRKWHPSSLALFAFASADMRYQALQIWSSRSAPSSYRSPSSRSFTLGPSLPTQRSSAACKRSSRTRSERGVASEQRPGARVTARNPNPAARARPGYAGIEGRKCGLRVEFQIFEGLM